MEVRKTLLASRKFDVFLLKALSRENIFPVLLSRKSNTDGAMNVVVGLLCSKGSVQMLSTLLILHPHSEQR